MATYRAKCWLGSASGYQELEVQANTVTGAYEQFKRIYGAEQIINCHEVRDGSILSFGDGDFEGWMALVAILFVIWLYMEFPWVMIPLTVIVLIAWIYNTFIDRN